MTVLAFLMTSGQHIYIHDKIVLLMLFMPLVRNATRGHRAVTTGPWPLMLTTNWDTMLEASFGMMELNKG